MSLQGRGASEPRFMARDLLVPHAVPEVAETVKAPALPAPKDPNFLPPRRFFRFGWIELLGGLLSRYPLHLANASAELFREIPVLPRRFTGKQFTASLILHGLGFLLLPFLLKIVPMRVPAEDRFQLVQNGVIYYQMPHSATRPKLPRILPPGPGSIPGTGSLPQIPAKGASKSLEALFATSHPKFPDNKHQTIIQPNSPPDLRIKADLKLPNLVLDKPSVPKPRLKYDANGVKPSQPTQREAKADAPALARADTATPVTGLLAASSTQAHLAVPIGAAPAPNLPSGRSGSGTGQGGDAEANSAPQITGEGGNGQGLLILGTDPGSGPVVLPPGNRYGDFSMAPGTSGPGSPGGQPGGTVGGGSGGNGTGGNASTGVGNGTYGGGGGSSGSGGPGFISLRGGEGDAETLLSDPGPAAVAQMVYAIPVSSLLRHNTLVVSAGPMGGGGSNVYGALPCGKIYTVFLATAGKQWSLQYCQKNVAAAPMTSERRTTTVVHAELPLVPPEAEERFDFKRVPLPPEKAHKSLILKGAINEDGKVADLKVYQGLAPVIDAAARKAFEQWKFKPAMRSGKPVRVEILVNIPMEVPKPEHVR